MAVIFTLKILFPSNKSLSTIPNLFNLQILVQALVLLHSLSFVVPVHERTQSISSVLKLLRNWLYSKLFDASQPTSSELHPAAPEVIQLILSKFIPRLYTALNVPKEKSDEIIKELLMEEHFESVEKLALEVIVYIFLQYIDRLEKYALQQVNSSNNSQPRTSF